MSKKQDKGLTVALDIGTSKIAVLVGEFNDAGEVEIIGFGTHPSRGLKRGVVVNIESTVQSIQRAIEEAEMMAGCKIHSAFTGIAGSHISSLNSHGVAAIRDREVTQQDVNRVIDAARAVAMPADQQILHILPQEFVIDHQRGVKEPVGMSGVRLEVKVHIVTGAVSAMQNISKCVRRCGLQIGDVILEQLASSYAVLSDDEKDLGVCLVDIGAGTTDIAIFSEGSIKHTAIIPIGGDHVTNDVAVALRTPTQFAEQVKIESGAAVSDNIQSNETLTVPGVAHRSDRKVSRKLLVDVVSARYKELFQLIVAEIQRAGLENAIPAGIVLTGGASKTQDLLVLAEKVFRMPVRLGLPTRVTGTGDIAGNPGYATGVGLLIHGHENQSNGRARVRFDSTENGLWSRMRSWFQSNF